MSLLPCFECEFSAASVEELNHHLWVEHAPDDESCSVCERPILKGNFPNHYACLFDSDSRGFLTAGSPLLCPVCGGQFESEEALDSHLNSHSSVDQLRVLGDAGGCANCDEVLSVDNLDSHLTCFATLAKSSSAEEEFHCPAESCEYSSVTKAEAVYHIWETHFNVDRFHGHCPGCSGSVTYGEIQAHLGCLTDFSPTQASQLLPQDKKCVICGHSSFSAAIVSGHYRDRHLPSSRQCPECAKSLQDDYNDVLNHVICLADEHNELPLSHITESWNCPGCHAVFATEDELVDHLSEEHINDLRGEMECQICREQLRSPTKHTDCLLKAAAPPDDSPMSESTEQTHSPVESHAANGYFGELQAFVENEKEAAREEVWDQYTSQSLGSILRKRSSIPELVYVGKPYHPNFDHQLSYQIPAEADRDKPRNIADEYGIYPGNEVILGGGFGSQLPRAAVVTFIDSPTIGFALRSSDEPVNNHLIRDLSKDDTSYHCVELINPTPFEREHEAISQVRARSSLRDLVVGNASVTERPVPLSDNVIDNLNDYQKHAVERALGTDQFLCIHGPPGTGKTRTLTRLIRLAIARGERVLATSHSNQAIDNLLAGSSTPASPDPDSLHYVATPADAKRTLPYRLEQKLKDNPDDADLQEQADSLLNRPKEIHVARVGANTSSDVVSQSYEGMDVHQADLVTGTMNALAELDISNTFDMVVMDEAAQATQPASFIPLLCGTRVILAGDHLQLPPYVADEQAKEENMHVSLFEHLLDTYGPETSVMLRRQYRMNEQIAAFPSKHIYDGKLETGEQNRSWTVGDLQPIMAVDINGDEQTDKVTKSKTSPAEAQMVANHVTLLEREDLPLKDIGVITPYTPRSARFGEQLQLRSIMLGNSKLTPSTHSKGQNARRLSFRLFGVIETTTPGS